MTAMPATLRGIAFFGGGSGGHLYPGLAVAERARERFPEIEIVFFRTSREVEDRVFEGSAHDVRVLEIDTPARSARSWLRYAMRSLRLEREIRSALRGRFDAGVGLGGYASVPGVLAARAERIPIVLLEQNAVAGRVTRLLAPAAGAVACSYPEVTGRIHGRSEVTGNPVRRRVLEAARCRLERRPLEEATEATLLVVGGSQGARGINERVVAALPRLLPFRERIHWIHVTGSADKEMVAAGYRRWDWRAQVLDYATDLPGLMAASDLVLARAGGTTLAELAVIGVPAILVPYPYGDRHQAKNAKVFADRGAARMVDEEDLTADTLGGLFEEVLFSENRLETMSSRARELARPGAADAVIDVLLNLRQLQCPQPSASSS